jgi:hypothetical protein
MLDKIPRKLFTNTGFEKPIVALLAGLPSILIIKKVSH